MDAPGRRLRGGVICPGPALLKRRLPFPPARAQELPERVCSRGSRGMTLAPHCPSSSLPAPPAPWITWRQTHGGPEPRDPVDGTVRRSFQEALNLVTSTVGPERGTSGRTPSSAPRPSDTWLPGEPSLFRRFSARSQQRFSSLRKRQPDSEPPDLVSLLLLFLFVCLF